MSLNGDEDLHDGNVGIIKDRTPDFLVDDTDREDQTGVVIMSHRRSVRVADLLKQEVSDIIQHGIKDPRIGFVTVISVDLSQDLRHAKFYISVMGTDEERKNCLQGLESAKGFVRSQLGQRLRLRHIPELLFRHDESSVYAARIAEVMKQIEPDLNSAQSRISDETSSAEDDDRG